MSQTMTAGTVQASPSRAANLAWWVLQIALAFMMAGAGISKLVGVPAMVELFESVGMGQWLRYVTGTLQVTGAVLLLAPALGGVGALLLAGVLGGAVLTHLFIIGGSPLAPLVLMSAALAVAWRRRDRTLRLIGR